MTLNSIKSFFNIFCAEGIFVLLLGMLIIILPEMTTFILSLILSVALILLGLYKFSNTIITRNKRKHAVLTAITSFIITCIGIYLILHPFFNIMVLTLGIGIYFILEGIHTMLIAMQNRKKLPYWKITLLFSILQFIIAFIIIFGLPYTALWTLGILIGTNLIFSGISLLAIYFGTKKYFKNEYY